MRAASLLLVHGAGSGPWVYEGWLRAFPALVVDAVDLHEALAVDQASMSDYANRVATAARAMPDPVAVCGWSMGGLVVLQAAQFVRPHSVILLEGVLQPRFKVVTLRSGSWVVYLTRGGVRQVPGWGRGAARVTSRAG
jgi:pimeloyl-ACP methyl ester carboxylesterase